VEDGEVAGVGRVAPVATPGHHGVDGQRARIGDRRLHQVDLDRRRVGAQHDGLGFTEVDVEGVPHAPGRVRRRDVERFEVVPVALDLGALGHGEAHADEDVLEFTLGDGDQVRVSDGRGPRTELTTTSPKVQTVLAPALDAREGAQLLATVLERTFDHSSGLLKSRSGVLAVFGSEHAERLLQRRQVPSAVPVMDASFSRSSSIVAKAAMLESSCSRLIGEVVEG
jgi:hypothetical protein